MCSSLRNQKRGMNKIKIYLDTSVISYLDQKDAPEQMKEPFADAYGQYLQALRLPEEQAR